MQTFKQFLSEARGVSKSADEFIAWADKNCSKYLEGHVHFYRGFKGAASGILIGSSIGATPRKSIGGAANNYTLWIDNHPPFKDYPKRSASFIATTDTSKAFDFGEAHLMICQDNAKIGEVLAADIWQRKVLGETMLSDLNNVTEDILKHFDSGGNESYADLKASLRSVTLEKLRDYTEAEKPHRLYREMVDKEIVPEMEKKNLKNMFDLWDNLVTTELFRSSLAGDIGADDREDIVSGEVWIEGTCGFIALIPGVIPEEEREKLLTWLKGRNRFLASTLQLMWKRFDDDNI